MPPPVGKALVPKLVGDKLGDRMAGEKLKHPSLQGKQCATPASTFCAPTSKRKPEAISAGLAASQKRMASSRWSVGRARTSGKWRCWSDGLRRGWRCCATRL